MTGKHKYTHTWAPVKEKQGARERERAQSRERAVFQRVAHIAAIAIHGCPPPPLLVVSLPLSLSSLRSLYLSRIQFMEKQAALASLELALEPGLELYA